MAKKKGIVRRRPQGGEKAKVDKKSGHLKPNIKKGK
jgi:hypothetical protein